MERLTSKNWKNSPHLQIEPTTQEEYDSQRLYTRLAELEDKLESGKLVECGNEFNPKFAIYEDVYIIDYVDENNFSLKPSDRNENTKVIARKCFITNVQQSARTIYVYWVQPHDCPNEILEDSAFRDEFWDRCLGEYEVFKTKEQAEAQIKELQKESKND